MVADLFESLLLDVGHYFHVTLKADQNNSCLFNLPNGLSIQMEIDPKNEYFIIGSDLGEVPIGKYRENLFQAALKANNFPPPQNGIFAYSRQKNHLILHAMLSLQDITGEKITNLLPPFLEKAWNWKTAITNGEVPEVVTPDAGGGYTSKGLFGLRP
jgi:hypothetical protein